MQTYYLLFRCQMIKHGDLHEAPIALCCHTMNGVSGFVVAASFCSDSIRLAGGDEHSEIGTGDANGDDLG